MKQKGLAPILLIVLSVIILGIGVSVYKFQNKSSSNQVSTPTSTEKPIFSIRTDQWKVYSNQGVYLKYPPFYNPVEKFHPLKSGEPIFIVTSKFNFNKDNLSLCETYGEELCLNPGKNHNQEKDIQPITLDGKKAISFYIVTKKEVGGNVIHVAQTTEDPLIEIAMTIDGMGGEETFQNILSTFKLIDQIDEAANWKTYTYKNISFQYPSDWIVVFDSEVFGQPNGFDLHVQSQNDIDIQQPDELRLSTYNDRYNSSSDNNYILSPTRQFTLRDSGDSYIEFDINNTPIYAGCAFYSKHQTTLEICNRILSTFKFQ